MPYASRRTYRRTFTRRPRFGRRYGGFSTGSSRMGRNSRGVRGLARRVSRLAERVGSPEVKFFDTPIVDNITGPTGLPADVSISDICAIPPVDSPGVLTGSARDGDKVTLRSIQVSGYAQVTWSGAPLGTSVALRMIVYRDMQSLGSVPAPTDILEIFPPAVSIPGTPSLRNMGFRNRFLILHDQRITLSQNGNSVFAINKYLKVKDNLVFASDTVAPPSSNTYGVLLINDASSTTTNLTSLDWNLQARLRYTDN